MMTQNLFAHDLLRVPLRALLTRYAGLLCLSAVAMLSACDSNNCPEGAESSVFCRGQQTATQPPPEPTEPDPGETARDDSACASGEVAPGESCDNGLRCSDGGTCTCGDDIVNGEETCDETSTTCSTSCELICTSDADCETLTPCFIGATCNQNTRACEGGTQLPSGSSCGDGGVCDAVGACVDCTQVGESCSLSNLCAIGQVVCEDGVNAQCAVVDVAPSGTECGDNLRCDGEGSCASCDDAGESCTPTNTCREGTLFCADDIANCLEGTPRFPGYPCDGGACDGTGQCVSCDTAGETFITADNCNEGILSCDDNGSVTGLTLTPRPGQPCGDGGTCNDQGVCESCTGGTCEPPECFVEVAVPCAGDPSQACTTFAPAGFGTACRTDGFCDGAGQCVTCDAEEQGETCLRTNPCEFGEVSCSATNEPLCVLTELAPAGTTCRVDGLCDLNGQCVSCDASDTGEDCVFDLDCTGGTVACIDDEGVCLPGGDAPEGAVCGDGGSCDTSGQCVDCDSEGDSCDAGICFNAGSVSCDAGNASCNAAPKDFGASCGPNDESCDGQGNCISCNNAGQACTRGECFQDGVIACDGNTPQCNADPKAFGVSCNGGNGQCNGLGDCSECPQAAGNSCDPQVVCRIGAIACTGLIPNCEVSGLAAPGTECGSGQVCNETGDCATCTSPNATEVCDGIDNNCDGFIDEGLTQIFYRDVDGDGFGDSTDTVQACVAPNGYVATAGDCDDTNSANQPGATEICDNVDNNCDGSIDEGLRTTFFLDADGDGFGIATQTLEACTVPAGYAAQSGDCNDAESGVNPSVTELCDDIDNNCDGDTDEGLLVQFFRDSDGDGFGDPNDFIFACPGTGGGGATPPPAGFVTDATDCNDQSVNVNPNALEVCNTIDDNCDGNVDEGVTTTYYEDLDGDGFGSNVSQEACSTPAGFVTVTGDCDDSAGNVNPSAAEICDGADNNCNGATDEGGLLLTFYLDADGDGFGLDASAVEACAAPANHVSVAGDCDDTLNTVNPGATEICDSVDNNCDGTTDEGLLQTFYFDADGDGFGRPNSAIEACSAPANYADNDQDCIDSLAEVNPNATEVCGDGLDNDCDGSVDNAPQQTFYRDLDGDGFGDPLVSTDACVQPDGYVTQAGDCNDMQALANPSLAEICGDGIDNNCDGTIDEVAQTTWYQDLDGDGFGNMAISQLACDQPAGFVALAGDCNDANAAISPNGVEVCDGIDNDCSGAADEGLLIRFYQDFDGDGFGTPDSFNDACATTPPAGFVANANDCDDSQSSVNPAQIEACDGIDNNCNGNIDEGLLQTFFADTDVDGFGDPNASTQACSAPPGFVPNAGDCDDTEQSISPTQFELCDGVDNNCNGLTDEGLARLWFRDADQDGYGDPTDSSFECAAPAGFVANSGDCDDTLNTVNPGQFEVCDTIDNNCNGLVDEGLTTTYFADTDGDGFGDANNTANFCGTAPAGFVANNTDCDDTQSIVNPGQTEICNDALDNDCNALADNLDPVCMDFRDGDEDGFCPAGQDLNDDEDCSDANESGTGVPTDCDDTNADIRPNVDEICDDQIDNDCDELVDVADPFCADFRDTDDDGFCPAGEDLDNNGDCTGSGESGSGVPVDCDDTNAAISPIAPELCNGIDDNCNLAIDENAGPLWFEDTDGDGYGRNNSTLRQCTMPDGYAELQDDCNDANPNVNPGASEICGDNLDNDCNDLIDDTCVQPTCGDGFIDTALGERCDDGNTRSGDGCTADCTQIECHRGATTSGSTQWYVHENTCIWRDRRVIDRGSAINYCRAAGGRLIDWQGDINKRNQAWHRVVDIDGWDNSKVWIGLRRIGAPWSWEASGQPAVSSELNWASGEPNNHRNAGEFCVEWNERGGNVLNDITCNSRRDFVCERLVPGELRTPTCLAEELCFDGVDNNCDGQTDENCPAEYCGDGIIQTALGEVCDDGNTDDLDGCSADCTVLECGASSVTSGATGTRLVGTTCIWRKPAITDRNLAELECQAANGHLLRFDDADNAKIDQTRALMAQTGGGKAWVGLQRQAGVFTWDNGVPGTAATLPWSGGEPNNRGGQEHCATWTTENGSGLNDVSCGVDRDYLCERRRPGVMP